MEGITDNAERQKVVSFVDYGYTTSSAYVLEQKGSEMKDHLGLCGLKGSAQSGTEWVGMITKEIGMRALQPARTSLPFPNLEHQKRPCCLSIQAAVISF
ncbi:hypothetical protein [Sinorhizobium meliloti]|uniref:hypothetical protein n=1 Tax=Rhizobium meliloti TaxID=382 RepID=UPI00398A3BA4